MVTIKDVAKRAGVSPSTASRAMHDNKMISEATRERVRQAMKELNYSPNYSAQNLVKRQANTIAIVFPVRENVETLGNNPFFMQIIQGITSMCTELNYMVSLASAATEEGLIQALDTMIKSGNIKNFIFLYSKKNDPVFQFLKDQNMTCVVVGQSHGEVGDKTYFVDNENVQAGREATAFLIQKGYRRILFAYTDMDEVVQQDRYQGYRQAMQEAGLTSQQQLFSRFDDDLRQMDLASKEQAIDRIEALVVTDDMLAIRLQRHLEEIGSPKDRLAMISFNNSLLSELANPSLTSVEIFPYRLGEAAAKLLLETDQEDNRLTLIPYQIIERQSTPALAKENNEH